jgi:hypothetical protein
MFTCAAVGLDGVRLPPRKPNGSSRSISGLTAATSKLSDTFDKLNGLTVQMEYKGQVEVLINGADVFRTLGPDIKALVNASISKSIKKMMSLKFPELGQYNDGMDFPEYDNLTGG